MSAQLRDLPIPLVGAPMAGGPTTDDLVVAVGEAGGLGFLATAYRSAEQIRASIDAVRARGVQRFGANLFVPDAPEVHETDPAGVARYVEALTPWAQAAGVDVPEVPAFSTADYATAFDVVVERRVPWVSFTFGLPAPEEVARLREVDATIVVTVTSVADAHAAVERGADVLWVQGPAAGGHRSTFTVAQTPPEDALDDLLAAVVDAVPTPVVAAGGVGDGADVARLLGLGAQAVGIGTLLLRTPEAGTSAPYRRALTAAAEPGSQAHTVLTRAFSGRPARGLANRFHRELGHLAPSVFPELNTLTGPIRRAATAADDAEAITLWAGEGFAHARELPTETVFADLWRSALEHGAQRRGAMHNRD
ncbi:NAD(P)H-dependent flavin oxidoreductase [Williamsia sp. MIQD14]|uniref:NAD(P)H-dependent flavin oxidoreductase n=1 Tax=Williamsia sp. MIQD14 TaxID=3425703 RepID=UPI003DA09FCA